MAACAIIFVEMPRAVWYYKSIYYKSIYYAYYANDGDRRIRQ